jgi:signal transduction histidine kinase
VTTDSSASSSPGDGLPGTSPLRSRWSIALILLATATALGLAVAVQMHFSALRMGREITWATSLKIWLPDYYLWAALAPAIVWLGRRYPVRRDGWARRVPLHLAFGVGLTLVELLLSCLIVSALVVHVPAESYGSFLAWYVNVVARYWVWGLMIYLMILAAGHAYDFHVRLQERELEASELETRLARSQLRALKMQLHPHFLFNTLHSVGTLVRKNERDAALEMLAGLADLLRHSLEQQDRQEVPLKEELGFLERYLDIEQVRFRDRLRVRFSVDPELYDAAVPNLLLQPLVENAVWHAVAPSASRRVVEVRARRDGDDLVVSVTDDGPGLPDGWSLDQDEGLGLRNVRERLEKLYGRDARLTVERRPEGGVVATARLPLRWTPGEEVPEPPPASPAMAGAGSPG